MNNKEKKPKSVIKIMVPMLIIVVILGIFILKSNQEKLMADNTGDFALEATAIDLEQLKSYGLPIVIDFGADSCIPCKEMAPVLKEFNKEMQGKAVVKFVDVWKNQSAAADFPVQVIPTQFFFDKEGNPFVPRDAEAMQMMLYSTRDTNQHVYTAHQGGLTEEQLRAVLKEMGVE
ncbi:co-chaperone YbbN [Desulfosporosinus sp. BICA1-9]|uniref:thioredoxin family protein n=1 Tax=Desulfosporosinus sp. BICA1-9 TaxID=1531958 RepID=UPI00054B639D|nr:thioredoxin family protein [Desulfosporosinus sp. BICA1-9]KJS46178.1 MAG: thioredoxin [Peptococcaceae bacterium BRH_c23]KJS90091.1 MAG: thioredoxin [Desulfosporosinus sp. BICA1-9]HBW36330.1 thioredoxin [Desulfosporosinus sp.]